MIAELFLGPQGQVMPTVAIAVVVVGMLLLAVADIWRHEVEDWAAGALLVVAIVVLGTQGILVQQWVSGVLSAAVAFLAYLSLGTRGAMGGGDVKLSVVPALVLGAANPLLGLWWIAGAITVHQLFFLVIAAGSKRPSGSGTGTSSSSGVIAIPHVPAMAVSMLLAATVFPLGF